MIKLTEKFSESVIFIDDRIVTCVLPYKSDEQTVYRVILGTPIPVTWNRGGGVVDHIDIEESASDLNAIFDIPTI